ncbi:MAG: tetratricopeptide repeat protein [Elusimicrobia bacterium]|nr:tetratricopeptide repeat protein [Elusimicrobiota bacterium]
MTRSLLLALALATPARAGLWGPMGDPLAGPKSLFESRKYAEVIAALTPDFLQKLKRDRLAQAYLYLGLSYQWTGSLGSALSTYQVAVKLFPKDLNLLSELATLLHQSGLDEQAQPLFQRVLSIHPNNARAHLGLAEIDRRLGLLESSAEHYETALEIMTDQAPIWRDYAEVLLASRDLKTAELAISRALQLSPDADSRIDLAFIQRVAGRLDEALASLDEALREDPSRNDAALAKGLWCLEAERFHDAKLAASARFKIDPEDPLARWIAARVELREGRTNEALKDLRVAAEGGRRARFVAEAAKDLLSKLEARK